MTDHKATILKKFKLRNGIGYGINYVFSLFPPIPTKRFTNLPTEHVYCSSALLSYKFSTIYNKKFAGYM